MEKETLIKLIELVVDKKGWEKINNSDCEYSYRDKIEEIEEKIKEINI